ncbi:hypothetical protein OESDEN_25152 [Oesophagostomum dentatum]|uniref:Uncharacterized protein n=1 Tax=Oesophagostomum dentatum TaxID=61180 RepID=A0A0B1RVN2_OESDE|nr:hypothetical protein OESDEN_25152 [Oesophagostomum dentatum]
MGADNAWLFFTYFITVAYLAVTHAGQLSTSR